MEDVYELYESQRKTTPIRMMVMVLIALPLISLLMMGYISFVSWILLGPLLVMMEVITNGSLFQILLGVLFVLSPLSMSLWMWLEDKWPWIDIDILLPLALGEFILGILGLAILQRLGYELLIKI